MTVHLCKRLCGRQAIGSSRNIGGLRAENAVVVRHISAALGGINEEINGYILPISVFMSKPQFAY
jgi:hypothetical protein